MTRQTQYLQQRREDGEWLPDFTASSEILRSAGPEGVSKEGYYGVPMLKPPTWRWHIAWYFFLEGISAGASLTSSLASLYGGRGMKPVVGAGRYTAFLSLLPCPPLLIADLGDPARFHHMLRVFKPSSPMNLGAWTLLAYSLPVTLLAGKQALSDLPLRRFPLKVAGWLMPSRQLETAGIPLALVMTSYPGVLLSMTSTPLWAKSRLLGALFAASSISSGVAATQLALVIRGKGKAAESLERIETAARVCEAATLAGYLATSGSAAKPLVTGRHGWQFWAGAVGAGIVAPAIIQAIGQAVRPKKRRKREGFGSTIIKSALTLAGSFALKWAVTQAGRASAVDPKGTREMTRADRRNEGWRQV